MIEATVQLSEPWDWAAPTLRVRIDGGDAYQRWPFTCLVDVSSGGHPHLPDGAAVLLGQSVELSLRHRPDRTPTVGDCPTVYVHVTLREIRAKPVLIGYGVLKLDR